MAKFVRTTLLATARKELAEVKKEQERIRKEDQEWVKQWAEELRKVMNEALTQTDNELSCNQELRDKTAAIRYRSVDQPSPTRMDSRVAHWEKTIATLEQLEGESIVLTMAEHSWLMSY